MTQQCERSAARVGRSPGHPMAATSPLAITIAQWWCGRRRFPTPGKCRAFQAKSDSLLGRGSKRRSVCLSWPPSVLKAWSSGQKITIRQSAGMLRCWMCIRESFGRSPFNPTPSSSPLLPTMATSASGTRPIASPRFSQAHPPDSLASLGTLPEGRSRREGAKENCWYGRRQPPEKGLANTSTGETRLLFVKKMG